MNTNDTNEAAIQEYGFALVPLDQPGAPTPGRIGDFLGNITVPLDTAVAIGDRDVKAEEVEEDE